MRFLSVRDGDAVGGPEVTAVQANDPDGIVIVRLFVDDQLVAEQAIGPYDLSWSADAFLEGEHTLRVTAADNLGNVGEEEIGVLVDQTPPSIQVDSRPETTPAAYAFDVTDNDRVTSVSLRAEQPSPGTPTFSMTLYEPPYAMTIPSGCFGQVYAEATDRAGWVTRIDFWYLGDACDNDCDGARSVSCGGDDCNDDSPHFYPGAPDTAYDARDQNCDGADGVDLDGDGAVEPGNDCDGAQAAVHGAQVNWLNESLLFDAQSRPVAAAGVGSNVMLALAVSSSSPGLQDLVIARQETAWLHEPVDSASQVLSAAFVGPIEDPMLAFVVNDSGQYMLRVAHRIGTQWHVETVSAADESVYAPSLRTATNSEGGAHLLFVSSRSGEVSRTRIATNASGAWAVTTLPASPWSPSIGIDSTGEVLAADAVWGSSPPAVALWRLAAGGESWELAETFEGPANSYGFTFCADGGARHLMYHSSSGELMVSTKGETWSAESAGVSLPGMFVSCRPGALHIFAAIESSSGPYSDITKFAGTWLASPAVPSGRPWVVVRSDDAQPSIVMIGERYNAAHTDVVRRSPVFIPRAVDPVGDGIDQDCNGIDGP